MQKPIAGLPESEFPFEIEGLIAGDPPLVTLDIYEGLILINAFDYSLIDSTYEVFINCHVAVNETI